MNWETYLAIGALNQEYHGRTIYHLCEERSYQQQIETGYYLPPTFERDGGFTHATENPAMLLSVANHFYKSSQENWICLQLDPRYLGCKLVYEGAASVGDIEPMPWAKKDDIYPHIYGKTPILAVTKVFPVLRNEKGEFLSIEGLC